MNRLVLVLLALAVGAACAGVYLVALMTGPDMSVQPALQAYDARMPVLPEGSVPVDSGLFFPSERLSGQTAARTAPTLARGKFVYDAYCVFCHGEFGDGEGPVGQSFAIGMGDLRSDKVRAMDDQTLMRAMLTGPGHDPVLPRVVPPVDRPSLLLYMRALARSNPGSRPVVPPVAQSEAQPAAQTVPK